MLSWLRRKQSPGSEPTSIDVAAFAQADLTPRVHLLAGRIYEIGLSHLNLGGNRSEYKMVRKTNTFQQDNSVRAYCLELAQIATEKGTESEEFGTAFGRLVKIDPVFECCLDDIQKMLNRRPKQQTHTQRARRNPDENRSL